MWAISERDLLVIVVLTIVVLLVAERVFGIRQTVKSIEALGKQWDRDRAEFHEREKANFATNVMLREKLQEMYEAMSQSAAKPRARQRQIQFQNRLHQENGHTLSRDPGKILEES